MVVQVDKYLDYLTQKIDFKHITQIDRQIDNSVSISVPDVVETSSIKSNSNEKDKELKSFIFFISFLSACDRTWYLNFIALF